MGIFNKLKKLLEDKQGQCDDCIHKEQCLCYRCDLDSCRDLFDCCKEKPITYCQCKDCNRDDCKWCMPEIN